MHPTAYKNCQLFFNKHLKITDHKPIIIDFGSYDINGSCKNIFTACKYIGIDLAYGPNVDIICDNSRMPFKDKSVDAIINTSCFEHDKQFWITFLEMCRIIKDNGLIYINAPSNGFQHAHPMDCWRFYPDSWKALEQWAKRNNRNVNLLETYTDNDENNDNVKGGHYPWKDSIGIFQKQC